MDGSAERALEPLLRELTPQVLGALVRRFRDFAGAEDAVQDALLAAARQWPHEGWPDEPRAWLIQVASRRYTDELRSHLARVRREAAYAAVTDPVDAPPEADASLAGADDTLALIYMCCHPALPETSAVALTLRAVGGLTTAEIARAFVVPEATMAQRISRAKHQIHEHAIAFERPAAADEVARLRSVLRVLYLIFNEGYATTGGASVVRADLATEAIRLTRVVRERLPESGEVTGLLALMILTDARRAARTGPRGELIPLPEQDRSAWDQAAIAEGVALVSSALRTGAVGEYQLLAAIAALHDEAASVEATDWAQIRALYGLLERITGNPMATLNGIVALAMVDGPAAGLAALTALEQHARLGDHHRLHAVRAHLLEMAGDRSGAIEAYRRAAERTASTAERDYLIAKAARLADG
jgi:RNA polymerase sigma factor (sigma-70 family)